MTYKIDFSKIDKNQLHVFSESRKRRFFVGTLNWDSFKNQFEFRYDQKYSMSKMAIPIGKELDLFKKIHLSKKNYFLHSQIEFLHQIIQHIKTIVFPKGFQLMNLIP